MESGLHFSSLVRSFEEKSDSNFNFNKRWLILRRGKNLKYFGQINTNSMFVFNFILSSWNFWNYPFKHINRSGQVHLAYVKVSTRKKKTSSSNLKRSPMAESTSLSLFSNNVTDAIVTIRLWYHKNIL